MTKEVSKEIMLEISTDKLNASTSVTLIGSYNNDQYFTKEDIEYYSKKYAHESEIAKKPTQVNWIRGKLIGTGSFGSVVFGLNKDSGEVMAVKQVPIVDLTEENTLQKVKALEIEIEILSKLNHSKIVRYIGSSREEEYLNIFLEYEGGGSIAKLLTKYGKFQENLVRIYSKQILEGLEYLHAHNVVHRDIKGANVLVDSNGVCKLADFGGAKRIYAGSGGAVALLTSLKGTPYWMAPEVICQTGHGRQADIWSFGCTVIEMATGKPPWSDQKNQFAALYFIGNTTKPPEFPKDFSDEGKEFLGLIFRRNPMERPNVRTLLNHPFIANEFIPKDIPSETTTEVMIINKKTSIKK